MSSTTGVKSGSTQTHPPLKGFPMVLFKLLPVDGHSVKLIPACARTQQG
jgi:hypothetical protein